MPRYRTNPTTLDDEASDDDEKAKAGLSHSDSYSNSDSSGSKSVRCNGNIESLIGWQVVLYTAHCTIYHSDYNHPMLAWAEFLVSDSVA